VAANLLSFNDVGVETQRAEDKRRL